MKICIILTFIAILSAGCPAFSWGRVFGDSPDIAEATAQAMEVGDSPSHRYTASNLDTNNNASPAERPLPEESAIEPGLWIAKTSDASKQVIEPALAAVGEESLGSDLHRRLDKKKKLLPTPEVERKEEQRPSEYSYSTIRKEIEDMSKQIGPMKPDGELENSTRRVDDQWRTQSLSPAEHHSMLTKGIEQAIAGLTSVYNTLRASNETSGSTRSVQVGDGPGLREKKGLEAPHTRTLPPIDREAHQQGNSTISETPPPAVSGEHFNSSVPTNDAEIDHASVVASSADKDDNATRKTQSGFSTFALLGGAAIIAAVGIFVVNHSQNQNTATPPTPLYPPRGPSYV